MAKQKTVAGVRGGSRIIVGRRFVQLTENGDIAAVVDLIQKRAVASSDIGGTQHQEFGAEFDQAAIVARRQLEIGNRPIRCSVRIEREEGAPAQLLIGAGVAEFGAGGEGLPAQDLDPLDPGAGGRREAGCSQRQARDNELTHDPCLPPSAVSAGQRAAHHRSATRCGRGLARALCVFAPRAATEVRPAVVAGRDSRQSFARQHRRAAHGARRSLAAGGVSAVGARKSPTSVDRGQARMGNATKSYVNGSFVAVATSKKMRPRPRNRRTLAINTVLLTPSATRLSCADGIQH